LRCSREISASIRGGRGWANRGRQGKPLWEGLGTEDVWEVNVMEAEAAEGMASRNRLEQGNLRGGGRISLVLG